MFRIYKRNQLDVDAKPLYLDQRNIWRTKREMADIFTERSAAVAVAKELAPMQTPSTFIFVTDGQFIVATFEGGKSND